MRLPILRMLRLMLFPVIESRHLRRAMLSTTPQINVNPPLVLLGIILQPQLATNRLNPRLDLLHMPDRMVPLADNDVQMALPGLLRVADPLLQDLLCFFNKLPVQVDGVRVDAADGVVLAENVLGSLFVVGVCLGRVGFALDGEVVRGSSVTGLVGLLGARGEGLVLRLFVAGEVAQAVVFALGVVGGGVVEGWIVLVSFLFLFFSRAGCNTARFGNFTYRGLRGGWRGTFWGLFGMNVF